MRKSISRIDKDFEKVPLSDHSPKLKTAMRGDTQQGIITHYRQIHTAPEQNELQAEMVAKFQFGILEDLLIKKPNHVFLESRTGKQSPKNLLSNPLSEVIRDIIFEKKSIPKKFNELTLLQKEALGNIGAGFIYASLHNNVTVHHNYNSQKEADHVNNKFNTGDGINDAERKIIFEEREKLMTKNIVKFLNENPGEKVTLIYGTAHSFYDDFKSHTLTPQLIEASFPQLECMFLLNSPIDQNIITSFEKTALEKYKKGEKIDGREFHHITHQVIKEDILRYNMLNPLKRFEGKDNSVNVSKDRMEKYLLKEMLHHDEGTLDIIKEYLECEYSS